METLILFIKMITGVLGYALAFSLGIRYLCADHPKDRLIYFYCGLSLLLSTTAIIIVL